VGITKITETIITVIEIKELEIMTIITETKIIIDINSINKRILDIEIKMINKKYANQIILEKEATHL
jgi:hypothetical protein